MRVPSPYIQSSNSTLSFFHSLLKSHIQNKTSKSPLSILQNLLNSPTKPNDFTFTLLIKAFISSNHQNPHTKTTQETLQIQTHLSKSGFDNFVCINTALLDLYMKLGCTPDAQKVFDYMPERDVVSWNAMISGFSKNGCEVDALRVFPLMVREGVRPCHATIIGLLPVCGRCGVVLLGEALHGWSVKAGLERDSQLKNGLVFMYGKFGNVDAAEFVFRDIVVRGVDSWNSLIGAYGGNGFCDDAMVAFRMMVREGVGVNSVAIVSILSGNSRPECVHSYVIKSGIVKDDCVVTSLICGYAKCGDVKSAELLFESLIRKDLVSSTAIISSYVAKGEIHLVVVHFREVVKLDIKLDAIAMFSILQGFTGCSYFDIGLGFHCYALKTGLTADCMVANGLISMYAKFNDIETVFSLFSEMRDRPLTCWNSVIGGCLHSGRPSDALEVFQLMKMSGLGPDAITIASVLSACSQQGYLQLGAKIHNLILRSNIDIDSEEFVGTSLIDMYSKCGSIVQSERVFDGIKVPCLATWNAMISGYSLCGFEQKAFGCYSRMREKGTQPDGITFLGLLSACTHGGFVREGIKYFLMMKADHGIMPSLQHYACVVALLGRAGLFQDALIFIKNMEVKPDFAVWAALLSTCCVHEELKLGESLVKRLFFLDHGNAGFLVMMSNLYAAKERWRDVATVREMMRDAVGDGCSGVSIVEVSSLHDTNTNSSLNKIKKNTKFVFGSFTY